MNEELNRLSLMTLPQALKYRAGAHGGRLALREKSRGVWRRTSWRDYFGTARHFAIGLYALGFRAGDRLAVASDDTPEWLYADLAAQMIGGACLGVYPTNPWRELQYVLRHSRATMVVCGDQEQTDKVLDAQGREGGLLDLTTIICVDMKGMRHYQQDGLTSFAAVVALGESKEAEFGAAIDAALAGGKSDDTAMIVYTAGTTGMPKGAMLSHRNMMHTSAQVVSVLGLNAQNYSVLCYLPLCHMAERSFSTVMQLLTGCVVSFAESVDTVVVNLREIAPKGFLGVPRIWEKMQQSIEYRIRDTTPLQRRVFEICMKLGRPIAERRLANGGALAGVRDRVVFALLWLACFGALQRFLGLDRVHRAFCGGASVSPEVLLFFRTLGVPIYQIYGLTENGGVAFMQRPGATRSECAGLPIDGVAHRTAGDGELLLSGPGVFKGYLFDEDATQRAVADGWLHTGDIVETAEGGEIRIVDRKKDILTTSNGESITPSLFENALKDSLYVREAILLGEGRGFLAALIQIDLETTGKWAQRRGIAYTTYRSLAENQQVHELVAGEIRSVNERLARIENVRSFAILLKELDHDDGELTATLKVRRRVIEQRFHDEITRIYGSAA
jgi:long-chain acyl-CoA synthetase